MRRQVSRGRDSEFALMVRGPRRACGGFSEHSRRSNRRSCPRARAVAGYGGVPENWHRRSNPAGACSGGALNRAHVPPWRSAGSPAAPAVRHLRRRLTRAGERIRDERTGKLHNYSRRTDVTHTEIFLPSDIKEGEAEWARDRSQLWNAAEAAEGRRNSVVGAGVPDIPAASADGVAAIGPGTQVLT